MSNEKEGKRGDIQFFIFGIILICIGVLLFLGNFFSFFNISNMWPLFMMIPVVIFIPLLVQDFKSNYGVLVPTGILTSLTIYFLWLNFAGWSYIQYSWPNFILTPAIGLFLLFLANRQRALLIPVFILTTTALVFYSIILNSKWAIAACFILGGAALLLSSFSKRSV